ncbi:hypothetical protein RUMGNA_03423 [Mediterraneibacter gnavus ATCC 29149]|uniref:Uncharacterized protein n=1 Tax=Mediterraneibacter gnavus (strain ATCC 29149 / DSM 114966 / JCM 6515 / VPI C7-9) TaxID=411470 RepID=A7B757_MEDG7|nr:hypothetical protein RUMGNA_03423 [Mediterraneibacter gnavus ATCC 29149]
MPVGRGVASRTKSECLRYIFRIPLLHIDRYTSLI